MKSASLINLLLWFIAASAALAQSVGDGGAIAPSAAERESYGINQSQAQSIFSTRHYRRGNEPGIGGSFLETTSPTSESAPAIHLLRTMPSNRTQFSLPNLQSSFQEPRSSALAEPRLTMPGERKNPAFNNPAANPMIFKNLETSSSPALEDIPGVGRRGSATDTTQFNNFGSFGK